MSTNTFGDPHTNISQLCRSILRIGSNVCPKNHTGKLRRGIGMRHSRWHTKHGAYLLGEGKGVSCLISWQVDWVRTIAFPIAILVGKSIEATVLFLQPMPPVLLFKNSSNSATQFWFKEEGGPFQNLRSSHSIIIFQTIHLQSWIGIQKAAFGVSQSTTFHAKVF